MDWGVVLERVGPGVAVVLFLLWLYFNKKGDPSIRNAEQQVKFQALTMERLAKLEEDRDRLLTKVTRLETENATLRHRLELMESAHMDLPWPMWLKDNNGIMLAINKAYENKYLIPRGFTREDYIGKGDEAVWPGDIVEIFKQHDKATVLSGHAEDFWEEVLVGNEKVTERFLKYPRKLGKTIIGIGGIHIPNEPEKPSVDLTH